MDKREGGGGGYEEISLKTATLLEKKNKKQNKLQHSLYLYIYTYIYEY